VRIYFQRVVLPVLLDSYSALSAFPLSLSRLGSLSGQGYILLLSTRSSHLPLLA